jgi:hypothetical protein
MIVHGWFTGIRCLHLCRYWLSGFSCVGLILLTTLCVNYLWKIGDWGFYLSSGRRICDIVVIVDSIFHHWLHLWKVGILLNCCAHIWILHDNPAAVLIASATLGVMTVILRSAEHFVRSLYQTVDVFSHIIAAYLTLRFIFARTLHLAVVFGAWDLHILELVRIFPLYHSTAHQGRL